ncbi:MAG: 16S rRNA (adenine(1518)-N(6)/adenine(1519)-N(6))-dimethyltransferase RsmA [Nitrososphaerales archaeon]
MSRKDRRKRFGQHFMVKPELIDKMIALLNIRKRDVVFEIGAGRGELTERLAQFSKKVIAYEIDERLFREAKERLYNKENINLVLGDAFKSHRSFDLLISNLPYSRSSDFICWLAGKRFKRALVTLQSDFVKKLLAKPGDKNYRAISVIAQIAFKITIKDKIEREAFNPKPKVTSYLVLIGQKNRLKDVRFIKTLFSFRGKKLSKALKKLTLSNLKLNDGFLSKRVEHLTPDEILYLIEKLEVKR